MASCSVCGSDTKIQVNGVPICPDCDKGVSGKAARSFRELNEALTLARQEYYDALAGRSEAGSVLSSLDAGHADGAAPIRNADARLDAASLAYAKALRDYRAFERKS